MPTDDASAGFSKNHFLVVGRARRPDADEAEQPFDEQGRRPPVLKDAWHDRTIDRHGTVVRMIRGTMPDWAEPIDEAEAASLLDIIVLDDEASFAARDDWRVRTTACLVRVVVGDARTLACDTVWRRLPRADIAVSASAGDFEAVARCFVDVTSGGGLIGLDMVDVLTAVGCRGSRAARGRALVIPGQGEKTGRTVRETLASMEREGGIASVILCQSISPGDSTPHDLFELDAMATAATSGRNHSLVVAGALDRPRTEVVVVAFDMQRCCTSSRVQGP